MNRKFKISFFCIIINIFTVTFHQVNVSLLNKSTALKSFISNVHFPPFLMIKFQNKVNVFYAAVVFWDGRCSLFKLNMFLISVIYIAVYFLNLSIID